MAFDDKDKQLLSKLAENLTGGNQTGDTRQNSLASNVERRMREIGVETLYEYLELVETDSSELGNLISALTIHTTSWFRENPHFVAFQEVLLQALDRNEVFTVWCAACSTGEEAYSCAIVLEEFRRVHPKFEYRVVGTDIDPISIATAQKAIYSERYMNFLLSRYKRHLMFGSGKTEGHFTLTKEIRSRCTFRVADLRSGTPQPDGPFDVAICRNVLIYFTPASVDHIVKNVVSNLKTDGHLFLGHSESIVANDFGVDQRGHSVFCRKKTTGKKIEKTSAPASNSPPIILTIDDSAAVRQVLKKQFTAMGFESKTVSSAREASAFLKTNRVDLITLDLQMPDMNGDSWLEAERRAGLVTPVIIVSDVHSADAKAVVQILARGAQEYIEKESLVANAAKLKETFLELIRGSDTKPVTNLKPHLRTPTIRPDVIMIGASTGGPQAFMKILAKLPPNSPPVLITQHISPKFTLPLAERLAAVSGLKLGDSTQDAPLLPGHLYLAYDDCHIGVSEVEGRPAVHISKSDRINGHRPSVDFMFNSLKSSSLSVLAILLTGMGRDGAQGLRALKERGAFCAAQSEEDSVVYGMPRAAIALEATHFVGNLDDIKKLLHDSINLTYKNAS